jgi:hypothetical protein
MSVHRDHVNLDFRDLQTTAPAAAVTEQLYLLLVRLAATEFLAVFVAAYMIGMIYFRVVLHR